MSALEGSQMRAVTGNDARPVSYTGKRTFDVVAAGMGLGLISPVMLVIAIAVRATCGPPVIYRGERVGHAGRSFQILKFRTMLVGAEGQLTTAEGDPRVTGLGRVLRRYKLDELPQLLNVLRGDMSLVGPRPEFKQWVDRYSPEQRELILSVRPGITDLASVEFYNLAHVVGQGSADEIYELHVLRRKNELRCEYVRTMSWRTDVRILIQTLKRSLGS
jgi:lipopolysaccharide/colanic/teichoic acid biosynthesis glycosyltransferase